MLETGDLNMPSNAVRNKKRPSGSMPVIECFCGKRILLVPDVKKMGAAIEAHAKEHAKNFSTEEEQEKEAERVRNDLIAKVLAKASDV